MWWHFILQFAQICPEKSPHASCTHTRVLHTHITARTHTHGQNYCPPPLYTHTHTHTHARTHTASLVTLHRDFYPLRLRDDLTLLINISCQFDFPSLDYTAKQRLRCHSTEQSTRQIHPERAAAATFKIKTHSLTTITFISVNTKESASTVQNRLGFSKWRDDSKMTSAYGSSSSTARTIAAGIQRAS